MDKNSKQDGEGEGIACGFKTTNWELGKNLRKETTYKVTDRWKHNVAQFLITFVQTLQGARAHQERALLTEIVLSVYKV